MVQTHIIPSDDTIDADVIQAKIVMMMMIVMIIDIIKTNINFSFRFDVYLI